MSVDGCFVLNIADVVCLVVDFGYCIVLLCGVQEFVDFAKGKFRKSFNDSFFNHVFDMFEAFILFLILLVVGLTVLVFESVDLLFVKLSCGLLL